MNKKPGFKRKVQIQSDKRNLNSEKTIIVKKLSKILKDPKQISSAEKKALANQLESLLSSPFLSKKDAKGIERMILQLKEK